jgi:N-acylneuraminate cytidylyltransferase
MLNNVIVIIPARGGSKRIKNKNIRLLGKKPLISYSIQTGLALGLKTYVSTDSKEIADISKKLGAQVINRPAEFAKDDSLDIEWLTHALSEITYPTPGTGVMMLRPTTPFRDIKLITAGVTNFKDNSTSLKSVEPLNEAAEKLLHIREDYKEEGYLESLNGIIDLSACLLPNQSYRTSYKANGYLDIVRPYFILERKTVYGFNCQAFITNPVVEIDSLEDFEYAEYYGRKYGYI